MEEHYTLAKWLNNEMTESELQDFQQSPHYETYVKIRNYSSKLSTSNFDEDVLFQKILQSKENKATTIPIYQRQWFKIAATILVFLGITLFYKINYTENQLAVNGKMTTFSLPDNSQVELNSGSSINYKTWNWDGNRNLDLDGEAYFKVAKGKKFTVSTSLGNVSVLGTQFNVKARKNKFQVTCYEGRVKVDFNNKQVILTKGKSVLVEDNKVVQNEVTTTAPEWTNYEMVFKAEKLSNVIDEINRTCDVMINLGSFSSSQLFTGSLPSKNVNTCLEVICSTYHLKITKFEGKTILLEEK